MVGQKVSKKKRCGPLILRAFELFHKYLRVGLQPGPSETELDAVGFHDGGGRRSRFKRWAKKLAIRQSDGMLILQQNGKLIVPQRMDGFTHPQNAHPQRETWSASHRIECNDQQGNLFLTLITVYIT